LQTKWGAIDGAPFCLDSDNIDDRANLATQYLALPSEAHSLTTEDYFLANGRKLNQQPRIAMP